MKQLKQVLTVLLAVMLLLTLCACGSSHNTMSYSAEREEAAYSGSYSDQNYMVAEMAAEYDGDNGLAPVPVPTAAGGESKAETQTENPEKIIYSASVTVETTVFDETVAKVTAMAEHYGGWIESSSVSGSNYYQKAKGTAAARDASFTLRIPSARFQEMMDNLSDLGNIPYSHIYTENVTSQYFDTQARLKACTTQEARLLEMMELAESVEDVIIIEDRLTELRYQIESLQSSLHNWDRRVSYSTISLSVKEVHEYTPEQKEDPTYWDELKEALQEGIYNAGQVVKDLLAFLVELIPVLIILIPLIWLLVLIVKKLFHFNGERAKARREARRAGKAAAKAARTAAKAQTASPSDAAQTAPSAATEAKQESAGLKEAETSSNIPNQEDHS